MCLRRDWWTYLVLFQSEAWLSTCLWKRTSIDIFSQTFVFRLRQAKVSLHFHSFSWAPAFSSITKGTHPPKMYIRLSMQVALCKLRGSGVIPDTIGLLHTMVSRVEIHIGFNCSIWHIGLNIFWIPWTRHLTGTGIASTFEWLNW